MSQSLKRQEIRDFQWIIVRTKANHQVLSLQIDPIRTDVFDRVFDYGWELVASSQFIFAQHIRAQPKLGNVGWGADQLVGFYTERGWRVPITIIVDEENEEILDLVDTIRRWRQ